ncbi:MAG: hypothetical protein Kilf2KO_27130 [Rhodospirillales bacterium]
MSAISSKSAEALTPVLAELRQKLLDLTTRNRLLAFGHPTTSCLRVIDELPDQLFRGLLEGQGFTFAAVPEPSARELETYHAVDSPVPRASRETSSLPRPKPEVWAEHCGLEVSWALPQDAEADRPARHSDRKIQTLLYPDQLDSRLRKLRSDARTAVEETGSNLLHLAFGFLEWREGGGDRKGYLAPLLLLPVELERQPQAAGRVLYRIAWTGEDLQPNLSLEKKLVDDFGLTLPPLGEAPSVERYLRAVRRAVAEQAGWRVRRYATLALFQFGKQLLYRDLDPAVWPKGRGLADSPTVCRLLLGDGAGSGFSSETRPEPTAEQIDLDLELVERSDSSQSAALLRALSGEDLVIQGPPGTGKSQSITNLIAAALARGKRVLFVSEKLAALEVVRRRLDAVGLGDFVLELHSHKTRKQALLQDLEHRLALTGRRAAGQEIAARRRDLLKRRQALQAYAEAVASPIGALGLPVSAVLLEAGRLQRRLGRLIHDGPRPEAFDAGAVTPEDRREAGEALAALAAHLVEVEDQAPLTGHPWAGVSSAALLGEADRYRAVSLLHDWQAALQTQVSALVPLQALLGRSGDNDLEDFTCLALNWQEVGEHRSRLARAAPLVPRILSRLGVEAGDDAAAYRQAAAALRLARAFPAASVPLSAAVRSDPSLDATLVGLESRLAGLEARASRLAPHFREPLARLPDAGRLRALSAKLQGAGLLRIFSSEYRAARRRTRDLASSGTNLVAQPQWLDQAAEFLYNCKALVAAAKAQGLEVSGLEALRSALDEVTAARTWSRSVEAEFGQGLGEGAETGRCLKAAAPAVLADLAAAGEAPEGLALLALEPLLTSLPAQSAPWPALLEDLVGPALAQDLASLAPEPFAAIDRPLADLADVATRALEAEARFAEAVGLDRALWDRSSMSRAARVEEALAAEDRLPEWLEVDRLLRRIHPAGVAEVMTALLDGGLPLDLGTAYYEHLLFDGLARLALATLPVLAERRGGGQDRLRRAFADSDQALMQATAREIACELAQAKIPPGRSGKRVGDLTDLQLIAHEVGKQRRHTPIRQLVRRAGPALQALKPCFMMGPQSVAQYLEPGALTFDLAIFDEASQLRPEEALGALTRAKQTVVVGDSNQLAPTSFFMRTGDGAAEEEATLAAESESILEVAESRLERVMLKWHYRSLHPDLIAFSNRSFYRGQLQLFPSPRQDDPDYGVRFNRVGDGIFQGGGNPAEAEAVVEAAIAHLLDRPDLSLGVVAMNVTQRDLIAGLMERKAAAEPGLAGLDLEEGAGAEPFFVKNLENVQGDERDVIMISMTYGPPEVGGRVAQRFGPINQQAGWRRLNVLCSRAKQRMEVFASFGEVDVTPGEGGAPGPEALKSFLHFAENGVLAAPAAVSGRGPDSDFERAVIEGLEERGFSCRPQIGSAGFYIDIGVLDPARPDRFLAGVECDGANYHATPSVRDRDHLRQAVLERLGWRILRVWSTDWFLDPDRSLLRLTTALESLRVAGRQSESAEDRTGEPRQKDLPLLTVAAETEEPLPEVLSLRDARARLIALRESIQEAHPERDRARGLLRKTMLDELLSKRPASEAEFRAKVRRDLREATAGEDLRLYGDEVFRILERLA